MSRFNPFHALFRRVVLLVVMLAAVPAAAQEVVVTINMNSCWNACSSEASRTYNDWREIQGASHDDAMAEALAHLDECMGGCEGPY